MHHVNIYLCRGHLVYQSKTQSLTALSSTEAEYIKAVAAVKTAKFIWSFLSKFSTPGTFQFHMVQKYSVCNN